MENAGIPKRSFRDAATLSAASGAVVALGVQLLFPVATRGGDNLLTWVWSHLYIAFASPARTCSNLIGLTWPLGGEYLSISSLVTVMVTDSLVFAVIALIFVWFRAKLKPREQTAKR